MKKLFVGALVAGSLFATGALAQQAPNTLGKIKAAKVINVAYATDSLPFSFVGPDKQPAGYSIDLCKRVIARIECPTTDHTHPTRLYSNRKERGADHRHFEGREEPDPVRYHE